jgi:cbb3-type cytochrome oxidase subunit 1
VAAVLSLLVNEVMTILYRQANVLYVSVWYFIGTFLWTAGSYPIGNVMWHPGTGAESGLLDSIFLWFYGHNLVGLILTPLAVGGALYVIPYITNTPLYSHTLSLIGFWTLIVFYSHIGAHHILQAPIPNGLKAVSIADSLAMTIPVFTALANMWMTARGRGCVLLHHPAGRLVLAGTVWYLVTCVQGPLQSIPALQEVTHFNNWVIGRPHRRVGVQRLHRAGRHVARVAPGRRAPPLLGPARLGTILADYFGAGRFRHRAHHGRPDPGPCLV